MAASKAGRKVCAEWWPPPQEEEEQNQQGSEADLAQIRAADIGGEAEPILRVVPTHGEVGLDVVRNEVLEHGEAGEHPGVVPGALDAEHRRDAHPRGQVGILAVCLLGAAPADVSHLRPRPRQ